MTDQAAASETPIDLVELTVAGVQDGLASGAFTCEALTRTCLARSVL